MKDAPNRAFVHGRGVVLKNSRGKSAGSPGELSRLLRLHSGQDASPLILSEDETLTAFDSALVACM
ncbi:MAG: hypothetical protein FWE20_00470 [Defluviitaleaceae bacterium]|nr:hypothetical protein [Defluviitaleaceae bacterium]